MLQENEIPCSVGCWNFRLIPGTQMHVYKISCQWTFGEGRTMFYTFFLPPKTEFCWTNMSRHVYHGKLQYPLWMVLGTSEKMFAEMSLPKCIHVKGVEDRSTCWEPNYRFCNAHLGEKCTPDVVTMAALGITNLNSGILSCREHLDYCKL